MRSIRLRGSSSGPALAAAGAAATLAASYLSVRLGAQIGLASVLVVAVFLGSTIAYLTVPHLAIAGTIALFAMVPALKVFVMPQIGAVKDVVCLAAISAAILVITFEHRRPDRSIGALVLLLLGLYVLNAGHSHDVAWAQGVRLMAEPFLLLIVGFVLPDPRRNLRYALMSLVAVGCFVALYGLLQQVVGPFRLVSWGYSFTAQVRTIGGRLRSFGTLDDPFAYAAFLLFGIAAVLFWLRRVTLAWSAGIILLLGLAASFVRTGALVLIAFGGLLLVRWRYPVVAAFLVMATLIVAGVSLVNAGGTQSTTYAVYSTAGGTQVVSQATASSNGVVLNGRISAWQAALGHNPAEWVFGRGVGTVGTAAARASSGLLPSSSQAQQSQAVDSGYFATIADVGLAGLGVLLALLARLVALGIHYARRQITAGWVALALVICMMLDALTRASFTGFPTAFLGLLVVGIALAAAREEDRSSARSPATSSRPAW